MAHVKEQGPDAVVVTLAESEKPDISQDNDLSHLLVC